MNRKHGYEKNNIRDGVEAGNGDDRRWKNV